MVNQEGLISTAAIIIGFGVTVFLFRIERELWVRDKHPEWPNWIPWADYLALSSMIVALVFVIFPLTAFSKPQSLHGDIASAACAASSLLLVGYIPAVLSHYRIIIGSEKEGPRKQAELAERLWVIATVVIAVIVFVEVILWRQKSIP